MFSSIILFTSLAFLLLIGFFSTAALLRLGLFLTKTGDVNWRQTLRATLLILVIQAILETGILQIPIGQKYWQAVAVAIIALGSFIFVPVALIRKIFKIKILSACLAWLPTMLSPVLPLLLMFLVIRPFVFEAFTTTSNSMAPTILGPHQIGKSPGTGKFCYRNFPTPGQRTNVDFIDDSFQVGPAESISPKKQAADRFIVSKILKPERWDMIVFRSSSDLQLPYVFRLVGLPGETIVIKDGAVTVDGQAAALPQHLQGINYTTGAPKAPPFWGTESNPARLGNDEYFVLGDFSARAFDSRMWQETNSGHAAFAVPGSSIIGVATHTYWPVSRWKIHK